LRKKEATNDADAQSLAMGVADTDEPSNCHVCIRGDVEDEGPEVPRGFLSVLTTANSPKLSPSQSGRLELAEWLTSRDNPLTARVAANRVWAHLFGAGIVETVDNFGYLGDKPSHPELLDTLAVALMQDGWSIKRLVRSIVLSRTYRLSSDHHQGNYEVDPDDRLVWRINRRRLDAESIRDAVLASSGQLDLTRPESSPLAKLGLGEVGRKFKLGPNDFVSNRRSVYLTMMRNMVPEVLSVFDAADPSLVVGEREVTTVATQALYMMNSPFILEQSRQAAERIAASKPNDRHIEAAYLAILGREPTSAERSRAEAFLKEENLASLCQVLYASADFRYLY
jgi:hypothetical protein